MRIIAGKFKGHQLVNFKAPHIRPTTDRVKETIFNKLMMYISGARVLDLFSGTGNLSFEALSRGALHVDSVESHKKSLNIIQQNIKKLKVVSEMTLHPRDVFAFLRTYSGLLFDIILVDPPFTEKIAHQSMEIISQRKDNLIQEGLVVIESSLHERIDDNYPGFYLLDRKEFGDKRVSFFKAENSDENLKKEL